MKRIISFLLSVSIITTTILFTSCQPQTGTETIALSNENFHDYFDVSVEYYNFSSEKHGGYTLLGYYIHPWYTASVSQRIKITPRNNVVSCENVLLTIWGCYDGWSYSESSEDLFLEILLPSNGKSDSAHTLYYDDSEKNPYLYESQPVTCPVPKSKLSLYGSSTIGLITISK